MKVELLRLQNFRNFTAVEFRPHQRLNVLVGRNGQGKTSVLEAIGILSNLRSFRGSKSKDWLKWDCSVGDVQGRLQTIPLGDERPLTTALRVAFSPDDKLAEINGKPFKSSARYLAQRFGDISLGFHAIAFNPSDHELVRGDPASRRSYLDRILSAEDSEYLVRHRQYQRALDQKNALLKQPTRPRREQLAAFNEALAQHGAWITLQRLEWVVRSLPILEKRAQEIAPEQLKTMFCYVSNWMGVSDHFENHFKDLDGFYFAGHSPLPSLQTLEQSYWKHLGLLEESEWRSRHALVGPQRDDWAFFLGDQPLKGHGSQGEVRSALLALKLTELELFQKKTGHRPVFLLDDFSSELDQTRRVFLMEFLLSSELQVFVTTTEETSFLTRSMTGSETFRVQHGEIEADQNRATTTEPRNEAQR